MMVSEYQSGKVSRLWSFWTFLRQHWYYIGLFFFLIPSLIGIIRDAYAEGDPSKPFVDFGVQVLDADQKLENKADLLNQGNLTGLVGMEKPSGEQSHIWKSVIWYWKWFWAVPFAIVGLFWFVFFPAVIIYRVLHWRGEFNIYKNVGLTFVIFFFYLVFVNVLVVVLGAVRGDGLFLNQGVSFLDVLFELVPFHGMGKFVYYVVELILGTAPPFF